VSQDGAAYDSKSFDCNIEIRAQNVLIKNSRVNGSVYTPEGALNYSFRLEDSEVSFPTAGQWERTMIGEANFTVLRSEITGGNRGIYCRKNCTVQDSWIHGTKVTGTQHASAVRVSQGAVLIHNTLHCDVEDQGDAGCSANLTGYPDFEAIKDNRIEGNLFKATPGGFCAYGGATQGKPFSNTSDNATNVIFKDNIFERGANGKCGVWGAITDFDPDRNGNSWVGNTWSSGETLNP
jgi:hypothetical protein